MIQNLILLFLITFNSFAGTTFNNSKKAQHETPKLLKAPETLEELRAADPLEIAKLDKYDSRKYDIDTFVKKQELNICWAYATLSASETSILREGLYESQTRTLNLSELNHAYSVFNIDPDLDPLNLTIGDSISGGYDKGYHLYGSAQRMLSWATPSLEDYIEITPTIKEPAYLLEDTIIIDANDRDDIKRAIARYGAVTVAYKINDWHEEYYYYNGNLNINDGDMHAVTIVGWDDTVDKNLYKLPAALDGGWIVKNSRGTAHAEGDGYFMMSYDTPIRDIFAFDFTHKEKYDYNYHYDGLVDKDQILSENYDTAVIFPAKKTSVNKQEFLKAVNVSILNSEKFKKNSEVTIVAEIYTNVEANEGNIYSSKNNPINEKGPVAIVSRKVTHEGSYTLELPHEIELKKGTYFSVVVKVISENNKYRVALSKETPESSNDLTFYKDNTGKRINCGTSTGRNVARIKAVTKTKERIVSAEKDLFYTEIKMDSNFKPRYNELPEKVDVQIISDGHALKEGEDYTLEPIDIKVIPDLVETTSDNDVVAIGTLKAVGKGNWKGQNMATFPILVGFHDLNKIGEIGSNNTIKIKVDGYHEKYSDIILPKGWEFVYKDDNLNVGLNENNYIDYRGNDNACYRRNMFHVIVEKTNDKPSKISIKKCKISVKSRSFVYNSKEFTPEVEVTLNGEKLYLGKDYRVTYLNNINVGEALIKVEGIGKYNDFNETTFSIINEDINNTEITFKNKFSYDGSAKTPSIEINLGDYKLISNKDYNVVYKDNLNAGEAKIFIKGLGNFKGEIIKTFDISKAKNELISFEIINNKPVANFEFGQPEYQYFLEEECLNEISAPTKPGTYYVKAVVKDNLNYDGISSNVLSLTIEETSKPDPEKPNPEPEKPEPDVKPEIPNKGNANDPLKLTLIIGVSVIGILSVIGLICFIISKRK